MKYLLTCLLLCAIADYLPAQQKLAFGPSAGLGISTLNFDQSVHTGLGFKVGVSSKIKLNRTFFLCPELYLSKKGFTIYEFSFTALHPLPKNDYSLSLHYLDFCLPVKIKVINTFYFQAGVQAGYLLDAAYPIQPDVIDYLEKWDFGVIAGMNWDMANGLGFSVVANAGIAEINSEKTTTLTNDPYYFYYTDYLNFGKNVLITGGIHYLFGRTKEKIIF